MKRMLARKKIVRWTCDRCADRADNAATWTTVSRGRRDLDLCPPCGRILWSLIVALMEAAK